MSSGAAAILPKHFDLLRRFGRTPQVRTLLPPQKARLWAQMCNLEQVPSVPLGAVQKEWQRHVTGKSQHSGLSVQGLPGAKHTMLGVTFKGAVVASHPVKTRALLRKLLEIHATSQPDPELFLQEIIDLCPTLTQLTSEPSS